MTSSAAHLDYFVIEANEYIERLDSILAAAGNGSPDAGAALQAARALRGSATMSRQFGIAHVARALERAMHALRERKISWDQSLSGICIAAVDDLRILVRNTRQWGVAEERRVRERVEEMDNVLPVEALSQADTPPGGTGYGYMAAETVALGRALDELVSSPNEATTHAAVLERLGTLRGIAGIADVPPLPDILDSVERALRPLVIGSSRPTAAQLALLSAAATALRSLSGDVLSGRRVDANMPELVEYRSALSTLSAASVADVKRIVPIDELFHANGPQVVTSAANPPTTPVQRFRLEVVSHAEHLRRLIDDAKPDFGGPAAALSPESSRLLHEALIDLGEMARSFAQREVAEFIADWMEAGELRGSESLASLHEAASLLANRSAVESTQELSHALDRLRPRRAKRITPTGKQLVALLEEGIAGLSKVADSPVGSAVEGIDQNVVPIETLLYRGPSALKRAIEIRNEIRQSAREAPREAMDELFDLLDLAV